MERHQENEGTALEPCEMKDPGANARNGNFWLGRPFDLRMFPHGGSKMFALVGGKLKINKVTCRGCSTLNCPGPTKQSIDCAVCLSAYRVIGKIFIGAVFWPTF